MATQYGRITIDGRIGAIYDADHEWLTVDALELIQANPVGAIVLKFIDEASAPSNMRVTIVPYTGQGCTAITTSDQTFATPKGVRPYKQKDDPTTPRDERHEQEDEDYVAVGGGSAATVSFTPGRWDKGGCHSGKYGAMPDQVLFHELVHAVRAQYALQLHTPMVPALRRYVNHEEFLAVTLTNVYMSAAGDNTALRGGWDGFYALPKEHRTSADFLNNRDQRHVMALHRFKWKNMFKALTEVTADFNPFREIVVHPGKYPVP